MRIAVTYENGKVFQHFGHTEQFKIYEVEDGKVVSSETIGSNGSGHGALAELLAGKGIDVLICGGIGEGAQAALTGQGIGLCAGASGDADAAVEAYLRGELIDTGANCDHHGHGEGHDCGDREEGRGYGRETGPEEEGGWEDDLEGGCGSCGSQGGGCGSCGGCQPLPPIEGKNAGKTCRTHYRGTFNDGTQFDSSYDRGEPLEFVCGAAMMIRGFDEAVADMEIGEIREIHLMPSEAYGEYNPAAVFTVPVAQMPGTESLSAGDRVYLQNMMGQSFPALVIAKDETNITFDANHEMAGKELNFRIELVEVREQ